jgi:uridine kinase
MNFEALLFDPDQFSARLFELMKFINSGINQLELYEFRYALSNLVPQGGWASIHPETMQAIERHVSDISFYRSIQIKPTAGEHIILDPAIVTLTNSLFVGLINGEYPIDWVNRNFYFDIRGFYFLHRTQYFTGAVISHHGGQPYVNFEPKQRSFDSQQDIGYKEFKLANAEVDEAFIRSVKCVIKARGAPLVLAIAGPTAAGKTEIVERLRLAFTADGQKTTSIEMDNFLTDRDYREEMGIHTQGKEALHFPILIDSLQRICRGEKISIPRYDFVYATSSHDLAGNLKPGGIPVTIDPADIIFIEGNFPFLLEELVPYIAIKVVYLTDDPIRMKRKWKRDIDYRKKYEPTYFRNRFFKDQFIMAQIAYIPQMEVCDLLVDTTGAALWVTPGIRRILEQDLNQ